MQYEIGSKMKMAKRDEQCERALRAPNNKVVGVRVTGESMLPEYRPVDLLLAERTKDMALLWDRDHVIAMVGDERKYSLKEWRLGRGKGAQPILLALNPKHDFFGQGEKIELFGLVIAAFRVRG